MVKQKVNKILIFLYFAFFPLGQIPGQISDFLFPNLPTLHISDIIVLTIALFNLKYLKNIKFLVIILIFSLLINLPAFGISTVLGALYLTRLLSFVILGFVVFFEFKSKKLLINSLLLIAFVIALIGLVQYLLLPDTRFLRLLRWDDHYGRLISTFLDPAFTGIILVLGFLIALAKKNYYLLILFLISIALTYSRSSYLALTISSFYYFYKNNFSKKVFTLFAASLLLAVTFVPKSLPSEGVNLLRTYSIEYRFQNSLQYFNVFSENPVFGIGLNNVCALNMGKEVNEKYSHSCGGSDNGVVFVLLTTGIVGFIAFSHALKKMFFLKKNENKYLWQASFVAFFTHGMFTNTLAYSFVLGWIAILTAASTKN